MKTLANYITEKEEQLSDVKTKWHPKDGLFTGDDPQKIADYLLHNSDDEAQAMSRLMFYMNRAGDNLKNKTVLNKVKQILKSYKEDNISEKLLINKYYKGETLDNLIENECDRLFWNYNLDNSMLRISNILYTLKYSGSIKVDIDIKYVEQCLTDLKMFNKYCRGMYIPQIDYTHINKIDNDILDKYNERNHSDWARGTTPYEIYYILSEKYFLLRIVTSITRFTLDFIAEL